MAIQLSQFISIHPEDVKAYVLILNLIGLEKVYN